MNAKQAYFLRLFGGIAIIVAVIVALIIWDPFDWSPNGDSQPAAALEGDLDLDGDVDTDDLILAALYKLIESNSGASDNGTIYVVPIDGNTSGNTVSCPSTTDVNAAVHSDVQRVGGENCAWTLRVAAIGSTGVVCPPGYLCTLTIGDTYVYSGDDTSYSGVTAGTVRVVDSYPSGDSVHNPCAHTVKEDNFGAQQIPQFDVLPGNFSCDDNGIASSSNQQPVQESVIASASACPAETTPLNDGTPRCKYGPTTAGSYIVPSGWNAEYWDGSSVQYASGGQTVTTGEATLNPS